MIDSRVVYHDVRVLEEKWKLLTALNDFGKTGTML